MGRQAWRALCIAVCLVQAWTACSLPSTSLQPSAAPSLSDKVSRSRHHAAPLVSFLETDTSSFATACTTLGISLVSVSETTAASDAVSDAVIQHLEQDPDSSDVANPLTGVVNLDDNATVTALEPSPSQQQEDGVEDIDPPILPGGVVLQDPLPADAGPGTCCFGKQCPYTGGMCCPGSTHCCPRGTRCVDAGGANPSCEAMRPLSPVVRVTQIVVKKSGERAKKESANKANELKEKIAEAKKKKGEEELHKIIYRPLPNISHPDNKTETTIEKILDELPPPEDESSKVRPTGEKFGSPVFNPALLGDLRGLGPMWPPMSLMAPDDHPRSLWVERNLVDWLGYGMFKNGSQNIVLDMQACENQCQEMEECRVFKYVRNTHECWLDSLTGLLAEPCPYSDGVADCITVFKRTLPIDLTYPYGQTTTDPDNWVVRHNENWHGHGGLVRNGKRNIVADNEECLYQCGQLKYCRVAVYFPPTRECWLASRLTPKPSPCALRHHKRECVSYVKKKTNFETTNYGSKFNIAANDVRTQEAPDPLVHREEAEGKISQTNNARAKPVTDKQLKQMKERASKAAGLFEKERTRKASMRKKKVPEPKLSDDLDAPLPKVANNDGQAFANITNPATPTGTTTSTAKEEKKEEVIKAPPSPLVPPLPDPSSFTKRSDATETVTNPRPQGPANQLDPAKLSVSGGASSKSVSYQIDTDTAPKNINVQFTV